MCLLNVENKSALLPRTTDGSGMRIVVPNTLVTVAKHALRITFPVSTNS
jgi:hypothetical protein